MAKRASYKEIAGPDGHLANLRPFVGNSMSGTINSEGDYVVRSYRTIIAIRHSSGNWRQFNIGKYSVTTSKHQGYTRAWLKDAIKTTESAW